MTLRPTDFFAIGAAVSLWASVHIVLRLLCRHIVKIPFGLDDVWAVAAWILLVGLNISSGYCTSIGCRVSLAKLGSVSWWPLDRTDRFNFTPGHGHRPKGSLNRYPQLRDVC